MISTMVLMESEKGWGFWSASVASMMRRSMSLTSGSRAEGMEKWSSMQMSPVWKTVAGPALEQHARRPQDVPALGERHLRVADLHGFAERHGDEPLPDLVYRAPRRAVPPPIAAWSLSALTISFAEGGVQ